jgi:hypothetical protein
MILSPGKKASARRLEMSLQHTLSEIELYRLALRCSAILQEAEAIFQKIEQSGGFRTGDLTSSLSEAFAAVALVKGACDLSSVPIDEVTRERLRDDRAERGLADTLDACQAAGGIG